MTFPEKLAIAVVCLCLIGEGVDWWFFRLAERRERLELARDICERQVRKWGHR